jgi:peptidoglycan/xylan/chitin deacetylase (PgdA/CDA1 family)
LLLAIAPGVAHAATEVAITVDDLPVHGPLPAGASRRGIANEMLAAFRKHKVEEVYGFINSGHIADEGTRGVLEDWVKAGYPLGNHTANHPNLAKTELAKFISDIDANDETLKGVSAGKDYHWFRYPFLIEGESLEKRAAVRAHLKERGDRVAQVTIDFEDWEWNSAYARCQEKAPGRVGWLGKTYLKSALDALHESLALAKLTLNRPMKHILLLHVGAFDARMADELLSAYEREGVRFVPLKEALADGAFAEDPGVLMTHGMTFLDQLMKMKGLKYPPSPPSSVKEACK